MVEKIAVESVDPVEMEVPSIVGGVGSWGCGALARKRNISQGEGIEKGRRTVLTLFHK